MSTTMEDGAAHRPSLTEQANAARVGRARFIGNMLGYKLLALAVLGGTMAGKLTEPLPRPANAPADAPPMMIPNRYVLFGVAVVLLLALLDLGVRRRHDRGARGWDVALFVLLALGTLAGAVFGFMPFEWVRYAAMGLGVFGLYLLIVLVFLPGRSVENRYGAPEERAPHV